MLAVISKHRFYPYLGRWLYWTILPFLSVYGRVAKRPRVRAVLVHKNQVLLVKNWLGAQNWTLPGGGMNWHESEPQALQRELYEELGLKTVPAPTHLDRLVLKSAPYAPFKVSVYHVVLQDSPPPLITIDTTELIAAQWFPVDKLPEKLVPEFKLMLQDIAPKTE
ncbi:MAG TPA: NUDIX hydrolase [Verrucomicrobiae bacterium]|nr:NUDIX hydrolase [Verrucomicrobiae bacterium]